MPVQCEVIPWVGPGPEVVFARLSAQPGAFWLDSSMAGAAASRFSIMGCRPMARFRAWADRFCFELTGGPTQRGRGDPLAALEGRLAQFACLAPEEVELPFYAGAVGHLAYELGRVIEPSAGQGQADDEALLINLAWYEAALVWDHAAGCAWLTAAGWWRPSEDIRRRFVKWVGDGADALDGAVHEPTPTACRGNMSRATYLAAVTDVRRRIAAGEIYQMNLAQCFSGQLRQSPADTYRRLRQLNPSPMGAYIDGGDAVLLSSSPEHFLTVDGRRHISTTPIKGTRPRGGTEAEDTRLRAELLASSKERAELLMIVDLLRNDLGRVCEFGSVRVIRLHEVESYATVHHLVGEVEGRLRPAVGVTALLRAVFPGGSIAGAPKVRAMRVIAECESGPRGVFSGAIGCFCGSGRLELNIAIRTIVCRGDQASFHVGSGIVWDSDPAMEYEETLAKGKALFAALGWQRSGDPC